MAVMVVLMSILFAYTANCKYKLQREAVYFGVDKVKVAYLPIEYLLPRSLVSLSLGSRGQREAQISSLQGFKCYSWECRCYKNFSIQNVKKIQRDSCHSMVEIGRHGGRQRFVACQIDERCI